MPTIDLSPRLTLHYLDENPLGKTPILLLHGLGANGSSWLLQIPSLTNAGFRILAPDTPGFGKSSYPGGSTNIAKMSAYFAQLLDTLQIKPVHVVGISMGGTQALQLAIDRPDLVNKLVLANTFARLHFSSLKVLPYFALRFILVHTLGLPTQARSVAKRIFPRPEQGELRQLLIEQICQANPQGYRAAMRALGRFNAMERLNQVRSQTLVITGEEDTTVPLENQRVLAMHIPGARHITVPKAGHAVTVEQPEAFNLILLEFLKNETT